MIGMHARFHAVCPVAGLLLAALVITGCEWIAGIKGRHGPQDAGAIADAATDGRPADAAFDGSPDAPGDAPEADAPGPDAPGDALGNDTAVVDTGPEAPACTASTCPNGCCANNGSCIEDDFPRCGKGGVQCVWCDTERADQCDNGGACACGGNAACTGNDYCGGGTCGLCGSENCADGCCNSLVCVRQPTFPTCGINGGACQPCITQYTDGCQPNGTCGCGDGGPCPGTGDCIGGVCQ